MRTVNQILSNVQKKNWNFIHIQLVIENLSSRLYWSATLNSSSVDKEANFGSS